MNNTQLDREVKFIAYWTKKRENKLKYIAKATFFQSLFFSLFMIFSDYQNNEYKIDENILKSFLLAFSISTLLWGCFMFWQFNLTEKRYQKLVQKNKDL